MTSRRRTPLLSLPLLALLLASAPAPADEGQWPPEALASFPASRWGELSARGLEVTAKDLWDGQGGGLLGAVLDSSDSDSCVTFSGGAVAAAGSFALEHPTLVDGEGSLRRDGRTDEFDLSVWYDRSHLFQVVKTADAIRLICSVKHISEGRLFQ